MGSLIMCVLFLAMGFLCGCLLADQPPKGFINIDCGAPKDTFDFKKGLFYKSDKDMITSGVSKQIQSNSTLGQTLRINYLTLRSFPTGTRNCYHLKLEQEASSKNISKKYIIRAYFVYENYDRLNFAPTFDLYVGTNLWKSSEMNFTYLETVILLDPSIDYIDVCLVNTNNGVPYITSLELRSFNISLYGMDPTHTQNVILYSRRNFGGSRPIIYPEDAYDRQWIPWDCDTLDNTTSLRVYTTASIAETNNPYKLPQSMLQTTCQVTNSSLPLEFSWTLSDEEWTFRYSFCFHFVEIEKLKSGQFREMRIILNDVDIITNSIKLLQYLKPYTLCSKPYQLSANQNVKLSIFPTVSSALPPLINGLEVFYTSDASNPLTFSQDVNAMRDIKQHYKLSRNWEGDPCQPLAFSWDGLNCSNNNANNPWPRIISLKLSNSNLTGDISSSISKLTAITYLDLSNNKLEGVVPESLALLPQLQLLNLSGNKLMGMVPVALLQRYKDGTLDLSVEGNQDLCWSPPCNHKNKLPYQHLWVWIMVAALITVILGGVALLVLSVIRKHKLDNLKETYTGMEDQIQNFSIAPGVQKFGFRELKKATNNFNSTNKLGRGGFGTVYKGNLMNKEVAIKRISKDSRQGKQEFIAEVATIGGLHHKNLVRLIGWCYQKKDLLLVYEYMPNGSLDKLTYNGDTNDNFIIALNWETRCNIICGIAEALNYLHNECKKTILHRDIKPSNVMLDSNFEAKLGDFGLARSICRIEQTHHSTREIAGTRGYMAPEIFLTRRATMETDVYAFGILVLEVVCRRKPTNPSNLSFYGDNITQWVWEFHKRGEILKAADERIEGQYEKEDIERVLILGLVCCHPNPHQRPTMKSALQVLKKEANLPDLPSEIPLFVWPLSAPFRDDTDNSQQPADSFIVTELVGR